MKRQASEGCRIAYVLKKFPRLSETFILNELLALESLGRDIQVFSLYPPDDEVRHPSLRKLKAPVTVLEKSATRSVFKHLEEDWLEFLGTRTGERRLLLKTLERGFERTPLALRFALALREPMRELGISHVHAHFATIATETAYCLNLLGGPSFSYTAHAKDIYRHTVSPRFHRQMLKNAAFAVTVCDANMDRMRKLVGETLHAKVHRIYNGIDLEQWTPTSAGKKSRLIVAVGRLVEKKGFDVLIEACAWLRRNGHKYRCEIIGDGEERPKLEQLIQEHGLENHVVLAGAKTQVEVRRRLGQASLIAAPCLKGSDGNQDALPTVLLEALATQTPIVSTPVGGIPEIIDNGKCGLLVPENDPVALAESILQLLDASSSNGYGERGRRRAEQLFNLQTNAGRLGKLFVKACRQTRS